MNAVIVYIGANQMKRFIVLLLGCLTIVRPSLAASHLALYFHQLESTPTDDAARTLVNQFPAEEWSNFKTMNLSEEIPVLAEALKSARPVVALFAGQQLWVAAILLSADANALNQLQTLMPLMEMNFNDPRIQFTDSDLPEEVIKTQNPMPWRVPVISFAALTHAPISPRLLKKYGRCFE